MLEKINGPQDIKKMNREELEILASEIQIGRASCRERVYEAV